MLISSCSPPHLFSPAHHEKSAVCSFLNVKFVDTKPLPLSAQGAANHVMGNEEGLKEMNSVNCLKLPELRAGEIKRQSLKVDKPHPGTAKHRAG